MRFLDAETVYRLLDYRSLIGALREAHRADAMPEASSMVLSEPPEEENKFVALVAWVPLSLTLLGLDVEVARVLPQELFARRVAELCKSRLGAQALLTRTGAVVGLLATRGLPRGPVRPRSRGR